MPPPALASRTIVLTNGTTAANIKDMQAPLPGADLIEQGLAILAQPSGGEEQIPALVVSIGAPKLRSLGVEIKRTISAPEHRLYDLLALEHGDAAHSLYNAIIRLLVSYERALACVNGPVQSIFNVS